MWTDSKDLHVTKLVYFIARILKHLKLHFSVFSMNFYTFLKFTGFLFLSSCNIYSLNPRNISIPYKWVPRPMYAHGIRAIPGRSVAGGVGEVGEKGQGSIANLGVVVVGPEGVGRGGSTAEH